MNERNTDLSKFLTYGLTDAEYQKQYRTKTNRHGYLYGNKLIRRILTHPKPRQRAQDLFLRVVGCSIEEFRDRQGLSDYEWAAFNRGELEIDHLIPYILLFKNCPEAMPFFHRWFNLRIVPRRLNRKKQDSINIYDFKTMLAFVNFAKAKIDAQNDALLSEALFERVTRRLQQLELA